MVSKINILFISSWFPTKDNPTLGNFVETHAKAVSTLSNVEVIHAYGVDSQTDKYVLEENQSKDFKTSILYYRKANSGLSFINPIINLYRYFSSYIKLYKRINISPDIVHANVVWPVGLIALWLKFRYKLKFVLTEHWSIYQEENRSEIKGIKSCLFKRIIAKASFTLPVSYQLKEVMLDCGMKGNYEVIPNAIDTNIFSHKMKMDSNTFNLLHISTLDDRVKNVSGILRTFKELLNEDDAFQLTIVSDGEITPFKEFSKSINIPEEKINFIGTLTPANIAKQFYKNHAFVLFSNFENLPVVILEAFATGTPVVSSDVGGISKFFPSGFGELVPRKDEQALKAAIIKLRNDYSNLDFRKMSDYSNDKFSYPSIAKQYNDIYHRIINL